MSEDLSSNIKNEEIRGLFVLGLLAVLIAVKLQTPNGTFDVTIGTQTVNMMPLLDLTITSWSLYAFFMVLGLSKDIVGKGFAIGFQAIAKTVLQINFFILAVFALIYGYIAFPTRLPWVILLISIMLSIGGIKLALKYSKQKNDIKLKTKPNKETISAFILLASIAVIMYYPDDWVRLPAFLVGLISMILYLFWRKQHPLQRNTNTNTSESAKTDDLGPN